MNDADLLNSFHLSSFLTEEEMVFWKWYEKEKNEKINNILNPFGLHVDKTNEKNWVILDSCSERDKEDVIFYFSNIVQCLPKEHSMLRVSAGLWATILRLSLFLFGEQNVNTITSIENYTHYLNALGIYHKALPLIKYVVAQHILTSGECDIKTLSSLNNYALCLSNLGRLNEAELLLKEIWKTCSSILGKKHPITLSSLSNYAQSLKDLGHLKKAEPLLKHVLEQRINLLDKLNPDLFSSIENYASCLSEMGNIYEAEPLFKNAWCQRVASLGENHPDTLQSQNNYATCLEKIGHLQKAKFLLKKTWKQRIKILGETHPDTLASLNNYAECLHNLGFTKKAKSLYIDAWHQYIDLLGEDHPNTLCVLSNYASCMGSLGCFLEAEPLYRKAWQKRKDILGENHPSTLTSLNNLIYCLNNLGRTEEVKEFHKQVWESRFKILGETHFDTLSSLRSYALHLIDMNQSNKANVLLKQAWKNCKKSLGKKHPDTLISLNCYAFCLMEIGRKEEAEELFKQTMDHHTEILSEKHPFTLATLNNYAECLCELGRFKEAESLLKSNYKMSIEIFGENHPNALVALNNYASCLDKLGSQELGLTYWLKLVMILYKKPLFTKKWLNFVDSTSQILMERSLTNRFTSWQEHFKALSHTFQEVLDLAMPDQLKTARAYFLTYHARYFSLCFHHKNNELIPGILMAIQGRKLSALLLEKTEKVSYNSNNEIDKIKRELIKLRTKLRHLALNLLSFDNDKYNTDHYQSQNQNILEYQEYFSKFKQIRNSLYQKEPDYKIFAPMKIKLKELQKKLVRNHAIGFLIQNFAKIPPLIVLITKTNCKFILLQKSKLEKIYQYVLNYQICQNTYEYRRETYSILKKDNNNNDIINIDDLKSLLTECFWIPCSEELKYIHTFHLITQGDMHILPYDLGCPPHLNLYTYPGLLFFYHIHHNTHFVEEDFGISKIKLGVKVYSAQENSRYNPIPLADTEPMILRHLWFPDALTNPINFNDCENNYFALHLAGHGDHPENDPLSSALVLGKTNADKLDARIVIESHLCPKFVFQSACVVGRTTEDKDGDPLGLVTAFFMRGASYIIASIQPVSDFYMPLLVCLFYQTWLKKCVNPHNALKIAKSRLLTGDWYSDTEELIRNCYYPVLIKYLKRNMKRKRVIKRILLTWPTKQNLKNKKKVRGNQNIELQRCLMDDSKYHYEFINSVLTTLFNNKNNLPVEDLCFWVRGFGWWFE